MAMDPGLSLLVGSVLTTGAMLWKTSRDNAHTLDVIKLTHENDVLDRKAKSDSDRADRESQAFAVRERLLVDASALKTQVYESATETRNRVDHAKNETAQATTTAFTLQTIELKSAIEAVEKVIGQKADAAFHESNGANVKIEKLHQAHADLAKVVNRLLELVVQQQSMLALAAGGDSPKLVGESGDS